jgi:hypothetical protein
MSTDVENQGTVTYLDNSKEAFMLGMEAETRK